MAITSAAGASPMACNARLFVFGRASCFSLICHAHTHTTYAHRSVVPKTKNRNVR